MKNDPEPRKQHLSCPFCGQEPGNLLGIKIFCRNEDCAIFDIVLDAGKWNGRTSADETV